MLCRRWRTGIWGYAFRRWCWSWAWHWLGFRALGFFGFLGLLGFQVLFLRRAPLDERDRVIDSRARTFSFAMTFIVFWIAGMLMLFVFDENGSVPEQMDCSGDVVALCCCVPRTFRRDDLAIPRGRF